MNRDVAPVLAAQALLAHHMDDHLIAAYLRRTWKLDTNDGDAALAAGNVLERREDATRTAAPIEK